MHGGDHSSETVCTIASRFLGSRPDLYPESLSITKEALALACFSTEDPITGARSGRDSPLDVCLALILWVTWMQPVRTSLEGVTNTGADKRWVWTGIAMRLAESHHLYRQQKLNGAVDSQGELAECSSVLNICTTVDRTFIILRPSSIKAIIPGTDPSSGALGSSATAAASAAVATPKGSSSTTALQTTLSTTVLARRTAADQDVDPSSDFRQLQSPSSPFATTHPQYTSPLKRAKQLQSQIVNVMTGFLSDALGPADNEKSAASFRVHVGAEMVGIRMGISNLFKSVAVYWII
ncbi:uncharacterized protein EI90DRAFT_107251 [Cantharellus anzutake]|uniref:uncharacterized protein n=1 Tax=Cantharellus anzutake TaxID=1750568 RepID=UPI001907CFE0|nr:uncharacterized protein EI90DRAFT_107251 [Cantharellus anzutake]KAF8337051.1 hypothetical protein EI90DRAFT_107251 [Cantharellus anzutake]